MEVSSQLRAPPSLPRGRGHRYLLEKRLGGPRNCFGVALPNRLGFLSFGDLKKEIKAILEMS
jgi:hypothetical protein